MEEIGMLRVIRPELQDQIPPRAVETLLVVQTGASVRLSSSILRENALHLLKVR